MNWIIALVIGLFAGAMFGVLLGSILAAAGQSYSGPVDERSHELLP